MCQFSVIAHIGFEWKEIADFEKSYFFEQSDIKQAQCVLSCNLQFLLFSANALGKSEPKPIYKKSPDNTGFGESKILCYKWNHVNQDQF